MSYVADMPPGSRVQFERVGFFAVDEASTPGHMTLNRIVNLRETWQKKDRRQRGSESYAWRTRDRPKYDCIGKPSTWPPLEVERGPPSNVEPSLLQWHHVAGEVVLLISAFFVALESSPCAAGGKQ